MDETEFYGIIKLVSGEEIFSIVHPIEENNKTLLLLENPIIIEMDILSRTNTPIARVYPWIKLGDDNSYIISLDKIITMIETEDKTLIRLHTKYVKEHNKKSNQIDITPNMGFISTVDEARKSLEILYKSQTANRDKE